MKQTMNRRPDLEFLSTGVLPARPLIHPVTLAELHEYFVERFPQSQTRERLYDNLIHYLKLLNVFVELRGALINGSSSVHKGEPSLTALGVLFIRACIEDPADGMM